MKPRSPASGSMTPEQGSCTSTDSTNSTCRADEEFLGMTKRTEIPDQQGLMLELTPSFLLIVYQVVDGCGNFNALVGARWLEPPLFRLDTYL